MVSVRPFLAVLLQLARVLSEASLAQLEGLFARLNGRKAFLLHSLKGFFFWESSLEV